MKKHSANTINNYIYCNNIYCFAAIISIEFDVCAHGETKEGTGMGIYGLQY